MINNATIYYFSGTGNAKKVAQWISEVGSQKNINVGIINIDKLGSRREIKPSGSELIGFSSPTHGFNYPPIMVHFLFNFPRAKKGQKVFIINTRAGMKMGKLFLPGLSGIAQLLAALILLTKGYKIVAMKPIDLPSNWISLHPGMKQKVVNSIYAKREETSRKFAENLFAGKRDYRALSDIVQDLLIAPIALAYYVIGRFVLAKTFVASSACIHCGLCIKNCPVKAIKYQKKRPFWSYTCESCMRCMNACPTRAIETAHGFIFGTAILFNSVLIYQLSKIFNYELLIAAYLPGVFSWLVILTINSVLFFVFLIIAYRSMYLLMKFSWFEKLVIYTSFTKYNFWRRYKPKNKI